MNKKTLLYYCGNISLGMLGIGVGLAFFFPSRLPFQPINGGAILIVSLYVVIFSLVLINKTLKEAHNE